MSTAPLAPNTTFPTGNNISNDVYYATNTRNDEVSEIVTDLNGAIKSTHTKRYIIQSLGISCFILTILLTFSLFITSIMLYFFADFGNVDNPKHCKMIGRICTSEYDLEVKCRGQLLYNNREYVSIDKYSIFSPIWPQVIDMTTVNCYVDKKLQNVALQPQIYFYSIPFLAASSSLFGFSIVLLLTFLIILYFTFVRKLTSSKLRYRTIDVSTDEEREGILKKNYAKINP
ncbi:hypothetical protein ABK040_016492 [Willaertia magna]